MTDYNDGKWHGWNGGECPVHPESVVTVKWSCNGVETNPAKASQFNYWKGREICAFRVITPYVEPPKPREFWVNIDEDGTMIGHDSKTEADRLAYADRIACIRVREVLE